MRGNNGTYSKGLFYDLVLSIFYHKVKFLRLLVLGARALTVFEILVIFSQEFHVVADIVLLRFLVLKRKFFVILSDC